ncbi:hypothetical protein B484DRAFT_471989, partial [Ochromonadaceae sp. CCMP2298]
IKLAPGTICSYLSAVRHHFRTNFQDLDFFLNPSLRACKTALKLRHLATAAIDDNEKNKRRLPFSADMLIALVATLDIHKIEDAMMITALNMGFACSSEPRNTYTTEQPFPRTGDTPSWQRMSNSLAMKAESIQPHALTPFPGLK